MKFWIYQKATPEEPKNKPKAKKAKQSKYEELPEIPDYERPELEKYEKNDFDGSKKVNSWREKNEKKKRFKKKGGKDQIGAGFKPQSHLNEHNKKYIFIYLFFILQFVNCVLEIFYFAFKKF